MKKVGFVGLGIMGRPMAENLIKGGCSLLVYDVSKEAVAALEQRGAKASTLAEIGKECEVIFTILPNGTIVKDVLFGEKGIATTIKPGSTVADLSSVTPAESVYCAERLAKLSVGFIDAPVSGGEPKAIDGTLAFMAGGSSESFEKILPYFNIMGSSALLIGGNGSGSVTKLANQIIVNMTIAAVSEAFVLATKAGADPEKVYLAIRTGLAGSTVLDAKLPMILNRNFRPGGKIAINHKDIKNVLSTAHELDVPLPLTAQLFEIMQSLKVRGLFNEDHSAIVKYFESVADIEVKKPMAAE